jgi:hypothetical protein
VLRVSQHRVIEARTPMGTAEDNVARIASRLKIGADEVVHGETEVEGSGEFAQMLRRFVLQSEGKGAQVALDALGKQLNIIGEYGLEMPSATSRNEPYRIRTSWTADKPLELVAEGMRVPPGLTPVTANVTNFFGPVSRNRTYSAICQPGWIVQEVSIEVPDDIVPKTLPKPLRASAENFEFKREWQLHDQTIVERSELRSTISGGTCSPDVIRAVANAVDRIKDSAAPVLKFERRNADAP